MFTTMDYFQHQKSQKTEYYLEELEIEWRHFSKEKHEWKWKKTTQSLRAYSVQFLCPKYMNMEQGFKEANEKTLNVILC